MGGSLYWATPAATTISTLGLANAVLAAGTTAAVGTSGTDDRDVTLSAAGRITANWKGARQVRVEASLQLSHAAVGAVEVGVVIYKNGAAVTGLNASTEIANGVDETLAISGVIQMAEDDYVEAYVYNVDAADNITVQGGTLSVLT
jgi:hypothetical protein